MKAPIPASVLARAALSRLFEPSDTVGLGLVAVVGPLDALRIARRDITAGREVRAHLYDLLDVVGDGRRDYLQEGLDRWAPRLGDLAPERDLATLGRLSGRLVTPDSGEWPAGLDDLQSAAPLCLWVRGGHEIPELGGLAAVVGSRDSTSYGASVTSELASGLVSRGYAVMSGGAYGIDAQAHRAALAGGDGSLPPTVAILACGIDRYYPAGNEKLLRAIAERGLLISEVPPGSSPTRWRFLQRNRLIAALSAVTVVVEARWRSGALNTAHHAAGLGRPVGAVPGSVHSANSAGCHRLLRDGTAVCVTDTADVVELAGPLGTPPTGDLAREAASPGKDQDGLAIPDLLVLDGLPVRAATTVDKLAVVAGLSAREVLSGLTRLELAGLAVRTPEGWRRQKT